MGGLFGTVKYIVVVFMSPPPEPCTVIGYVPGCVIYDVSIVTVDVAVGLAELGEKLQVAPAGNPKQLSST